MVQGRQEHLSGKEAQTREVHAALRVDVCHRRVVQTDQDKLVVDEWAEVVKGIEGHLQLQNIDVRPLEVRLP
jgi:hypothetical protein